MCLRMMYYPLVELDSGKRKLLLNYGIKVTSREAFEDLRRINDDFKYGNLVRSASLNDVWKKEDIKRFVKMVSIPCGCCRECMNMVSAEWAYRLVKEAELYPNNSWFLTFTYDDDNIPDNGMLVKDEISRFNKKLKVYLDRKGLDSKFRFYAVGEYGSTTARPHYHGIYFGVDLPDLKFEYKTSNGDFIYSSEFLTNCWAKGFVVIGKVSIASASYVARYCEKKKRLNKTERLDLIDKGIVPEFSVMSRRPGIGSAFKQELHERFVDGKNKEFINGSSYSIPIRWLKEFKELDKDLPHLEEYEKYADIKSANKIEKLLKIADNTDLDFYLEEKNKKKSKRL